VKAVVQRTGLSRTTVWRLERRGLFPARRQISPGTIGWIATEVEDWINRRPAKKAVDLP
jgi:prophage regulatory protein